MKTLDKHIECSVEEINKKLHENQLKKEKIIKTPFKITESLHNK